MRRILSPDLLRELEELESHMPSLWRPSDLASAEEVYRRYADCVDVALLVAPHLPKKTRRRFLAAGSAVILVALLVASFSSAKPLRRAYAAIHTPLVCPPMICVFEVPTRDGCTLEARLENPREHPVWFVLPPSPSALTPRGSAARVLALSDGHVAAQLDPGARVIFGNWPRLTSGEDFHVVVAESDDRDDDMGHYVITIATQQIWRDAPCG